MMKLKALIAAAFVAVSFASMSAPTFAKDKMAAPPVAGKMDKMAPAAPKTAKKAVPEGMVHRKGGYVHAHTYTKKNGTVVHVGGHYRKATNAKKPVKK
ncbi:MAG TPA: hypothetical protein VGK19_14905 [Capsulimonadaceae bacterium]|jgi:hypothetical protein